MPKLAMQIAHTLGREEATRRLKRELAKVRGQVSDIEEQWNDHTLTFRFKVMSFSITGTVAVEDTVVKIDVDLPLAAVMIKGMIEQRLRQEVAGVLTAS